MKQNLSKLMEAELDQAELVLAAKGLASEVQSMTEKVAKMRVDDLLPLVDRIKEVFSVEQGEQFQTSVDQALESVQVNLTETKDTVENAALVLNGEAPAGMDGGMMPPMPGEEPSDMDPMGGDPTMGLDGEPELGGEVPGEEGDMFGAVDANAGEGEPLGRARRESFRKKGRKISERKVRKVRQSKLSERKVRQRKISERRVISLRKKIKFLENKVKQRRAQAKV